MSNEKNTSDINTAVQELERQSMIDKLSRAAQLFEDAGDFVRQAGVLYQLAAEYKKQRAFISCRDMYGKALLVFKKVDDKKSCINCMYNIAVLDSDAGYLQEALEGFMAALIMYHEIEDVYGQGSCYSHIAAICMETKEYQRAIENCSRSLNLARQIGNPLVEAIELCNLANAYMETGYIELALQNYTYAQQVFHQLGYYNREGVTWTQIGDIHVDRDEYTTALECFQQAETLFGLADEKDVQKDFVYLYHCLSRLYIKQEQWGEARHYLHKALDKAEKTQFKTEEYALHERLSEVCERLDDMRQALYHYKKYTEIKDEILNQEKQKVITEMQAKFDVETAEREKELFRVKNVELSAALEEVHRLNDRLTKLNNEKNAVLSVVAHDLKSPLSGVKMVSSLLKSHYEQMPKEELYHQLDTIEQTSERMLTIATSLLKAQTLEDGGLYDTVEPVDVTALVSSVVDRYRNAAAQKNIHVVIEQVGAAQEVLCNREGLEQVVENLVSNAVKFTPSGRKVFIRVKRSKRGVSVEVEDEGPGISRRDRSRLFGKFARLSAQSTGGESTTGLGLWIAKQTMLAMGGDIRYVSKQGTGALFRVSLRQPVVDRAKKNAQTA